MVAIKNDLYGQYYWMDFIVGLCIINFTCLFFPYFFVLYELYHCCANAMIIFLRNTPAGLEGNVQV